MPVRLRHPHGRLGRLCRRAHRVPRRDLSVQGRGRGRGVVRRAGCCVRVKVARVLRSVAVAVVLRYWRGAAAVVRVGCARRGRRGRRGHAADVRRAVVCVGAERLGLWRRVRRVVQR